MTDLNKLLEAVDSKETFIEFTQALKNDKIDEEKKEKIYPSSPYGPGANGWENSSIEMFLDAMEAFAQDSHLIDEQPSWKNFALLLYAGKFYE
jgi:hypothetical protein